MDKYYLAVDIGASSGRHMLASMKDGKMQLEEVYRFPNGMTEKNGTLCWEWSVFDNSGAGRSTAVGGVECK